MRLILLILWFQFRGSRAVNTVNRGMCQSLGGFYRDSSDSCFWLGTVQKTWEESYAYCASNDVIPLANYTGRLAKIDTAQLWMDVVTNTYPSSTFWIGLRAMGPDPASDLSNWKWMIVLDNPNGAYDFTYVPTLHQLQNRRYITSYVSSKYLRNHQPPERLYYPMCEFITDTCKTDNIDCGLTKTCVSDSPDVTHQCICPFGKSGTNCENSNYEATKCQFIGGIYKASSKSCFWTPSTQTKTWHDSFEYCASKDVIPFPDYIGRLAHIDTAQVWTDITTTTFPTTYFWIGHRWLGVSSNSFVSDWKWMITVDNPNGAHGNTYEPPVDYLKYRYRCAYGLRTELRNHKSCDTLYIPLCEFIPDTCKTQTIDCGLTKTCVSDTPNTHQCICPFGKSGTNCENSSYVATKCEFMGGLYRVSTKSCFMFNRDLKGVLTSKTWADAFAYCQENVPFNQYVGRLAHIDTEELFNSVKNKRKGFRMWTGFHAMGIDPHKNLTLWKWMLTTDNPNGAKSVNFKPASFDYHLHGTKICGGIFNDQFSYRDCHNQYEYSLCEFIPDTCTLDNVDCGPKKTCILDTPNTHQCICPFGRTGTNCEISTAEADTCNMYGGIYRSSSSSCFWASTATKLWHNGYDYCSSRDVIPIPNYTGRMAHIDTAELFYDILSTFYDHSFFTGHFHKGPNSLTSISNWKWMLKGNNPNGAKNTGAWPTDSFGYSGTDMYERCGQVRYGKFANTIDCEDVDEVMCEFIPDKCTLENIDCGSNKICVSDSYNTHQCICRPDYKGTNCDVRDLQQVPTFSNTAALYPQITFSSSACTSIVGGVYKSGSNSCFVKGAKSLAWQDSFSYCGTQEIVPFKDYTGRLARIDTSQLWDAIVAKYPIDILNIGHRLLGPSPYNISSWKWMLTPYNTNGAHDTTFEPPFIYTTMKGNCATYYKGLQLKNNDLCGRKYPLCEFIPDRCKTHNINCGSNKICVSDSPNTHQCICPFGFSGTNCEISNFAEESCRFMGGVYSASSESCFWIGPKTRAWREGFAYCASYAKTFPNNFGSSYIGRLAHIDSEELLSNITAKYPTSVAHIGHRALGPNPNLNVSSWKWMISADNTNGVHNTTFEPINFVYTTTNKFCATYYKGQLKNNYGCIDKQLPLCQFIPDICKIQNIDCGPNKICVSDSPKAYQCICPMGKSGINCEISDVVSEACRFIGGVYSVVSESCFWMGITTRTWHDGFAYCTSYAKSFSNKFGGSYTGRLAHIDNEELLNDITAKFPSGVGHIGHRALGPNPNLNVSSWKWMLTADNPNGAHTTTFESTNFDYTTANKFCATYYKGQVKNNYGCINKQLPLCQIIPDVCTTDNIDCGPKKTCVSDLPKTHKCICPIGKSGPNCEISNLAAESCRFIGGVYKAPSESCFWMGDVSKSWRDSFAYCASKAKTFPNHFGIIYAGRLAHIDTEQLWSDIRAKHPTSTFHIGHHMLGPSPSSDIADWKMMLTADNPNGAHENVFVPNNYTYTTQATFCGAGYNDGQLLCRENTNYHLVAGS